MHSIHLRAGLAPAAPAITSIRTAFARAWATLTLWCRILRTRRDLADADPRMLADLGISPAQAEFQLRAAPWTLAAWRRR